MGLPLCTLATCMSLVLAGVYRVPRLKRACTVRSCVTREGFSFVCKFAKKPCVYGCVHAIHVILNMGTVHASIKFKSNCTVLIITNGK